MVTKNPLHKDVLPSPQCRKCEDFKPVEAFVLSTLSKSKHRGCCKACWSDYVKARRQAKEVERRITTTSLSLDVEALHAFAGQIVAAVKELALLSPDATATHLALALEESHAALEANLASVQAGQVANGLPPLPLPKPSATKNEALPGDPGASKIKNGLTWVPETEFQAVKEVNKQGFSEFVAEASKRKVVEVVTEIQADLNPVPQRASLVRGELMAELLPLQDLQDLQDLPDGATEDNYAQAQMVAEDEAERLALAAAQAEAAADAQNLAALEKELADASHLPQESFPVVVEGTPQEILLGANKIVVDLDLTKDNF